MNENKFKIRALAKWRADSAEVFRLIGLRPAQYEELLGMLADMGTEKIIAEQAQFLFNFAECGSKLLGERYEVTDRSIRNWRGEYLESRYEIAMGKNKAA